MLSIEKDSKASEICIHGTPESLREFAKKLWVIAEKSESSGESRERLTTKATSDLQLSNKLQGKAGKYSIVDKLTVYGHGN